MSNLGNFESEEQKQQVIKYILETLNGASGQKSLGLNLEFSVKDVFVDHLTKEEVQLILQEMNFQKNSSGKASKNPVSSQTTVNKQESIVPSGKAWILHKNGFSLVDLKDLQDIVENQLLKEAKLPPLELIHPSEKQRYLQEVERIKKSARSWIDRDFYFDYENNTSEVNVLTSIGKYSWKHQPTEAKDVYVQSSKDFTEESKERVPVKAWETFKFSADQVFVVNPKAIDLMREELKHQGLE